jgi:hypothetical protein
MWNDGNVAVKEPECKERRDNISATTEDKIEGIKESHQIFRWVLSTFLVLYFIVLGFSLQRIILLESKLSSIETKLTMFENVISYNFRKLTKEELFQHRK